VRDEIGVDAVRAHAILHDDLGVYREVDGQPVHDFSRIDVVYDLLLSIGLRPCVEIGFMPRELASEPDKTVFAYRGIISPPKDWDRWFDLVRDLTAHLLERYGSQVLSWDFEVWNEANLEVFWSSTREEWMRLYDVTARAVKDVDARIAVGGPSSAASGWVDDLLEHAGRSGSPVDFVSTHTYGSPPLDLRPTLSRLGFPDARILWTEWGVTPTHFHPVNDGTSSATFLLSGMRSSAGRVDALSYWVASDHFEELGRPPRLLHGGFGLITVGGIAKPRYHALWLLAQLGDVELPVTASGDGADGLVQAWATRRGDGKLAVLVWCSTLDQTKRDGDPALARRVRLRLAGTSSNDATITRLDREHGDITTLAAQLGIDDWPSADQWDKLRTVDQLTPERVDLSIDGDASVIELVLPQPGAVLIEVG
jgi:xylan 1,4-beta-xylosidase